MDVMYVVLFLIILKFEMNNKILLKKIFFKKKILFIFVWLFYFWFLVLFGYCILVGDILLFFFNVVFKDNKIKYEDGM